MRGEKPIRNHIFCAITGFVKLELLRFNKKITHWYEIKRDLFIETIRNYVLTNDAKFSDTVNA